MTTEQILSQIKHLQDLGQQGIDKRTYGSSYVPQPDYFAFKTASLSFISMLYGEKHPYFTIFKGSIINSSESTVLSGINILEQIRYEVKNGLLNNLKQLLAADIFTDFLEMAEHLLS